MSSTAPRMTDVFLARERIAPHLRPTPLYAHPALQSVLGTEVWVKHENYQPVGAFKVRGGINLMAAMGDDERRRGVSAASTGNHGQSIAYAARLFGVPAVIVVPDGANPVKVDAMRGLGATVIEHGRDFDEAREHCEAISADHGYRYVHSGNEPLLIAGVATLFLEMFEEQPEIDVLIGPVGGGSGMAGACIVAKTIRPETRVVAVQSEAAPAAYLSWQAGKPVEATNTTAAEGLATRTAFELPQQILREHLDDFILVSEAELVAATRLMIETTKSLVEHAGAAALAGALKLRDELQGRRVGLVCSGGNLSPAQLRTVLAQA